MKKNRLIFSIIFIICLILIDQISKFIVVNNNIQITNPVISVEIIKNTGMAFGFGSGNLKNIIISLFVIIIVINFMIKQAELIDLKTNISVCLILGGALGNLLDRFTRGGIIDFIKIYKFPIFNIADVFVIIGWILLVTFLIIFSNKNRREIFEKQDKNIRD